MAFADSEDYYVVFEGSEDDEDVNSSDDNDDESFWGELQRLSDVKRKQKTDADDFENEMNRELNNTMNVLHENNHLIVGTQPSTSSGVGADNKSSKEKQFYDDIYFDSDSDDEAATIGPVAKKKKQKRPVISNDDLFYDPDMDQADQDWMDRRYRSHRRVVEKKPLNGKNAPARPKPLPHSDAVLNCPACMVTLCVDCQRHETYRGQYRAMFVLNCEVDASQVLKYPIPKDKKKSRKRPLTSDDSASSAQEDNYNPVRCNSCKTEVAVYDKEEVYHFYNVLSSFV